MKRRFMLAVLACYGALACGASADIFREATASRTHEIRPDYFAMIFQGLVPVPGSQYPATQWPRDPLKFPSIRLWDTTTRWADVAPAPGQWRFEHLDRYVEIASRQGAQILYVLGSTPSWASARPDEPCPYGKGCAAEPVRMAHWEEYVRRVAQRYRGRIVAYELWNEPNVVDNFPNRAAMKGYFFTGSVAQLVEMARIARKVLDEVDPSAILTTPGIVNAPIILDQFLGAGGKQYVQAVAYHFYSSSDADFAEQIVTIRKIMNRHGVGDFPLWNTEAGFPVYRADEALPPGAQRLSAKEAAARMAQVLIVGAASGLDRFYYYAWDSKLMGLVNFSGDPLPGFEAMRKVQAWVTGSRLKGCAGLGGGGVRCDGEAGGRPFILVWGDKSGDRDIAVPRGWRVSGVDPLFGSQLRPASARSGNVTLTLDVAPTRILLDRVILQ